MSPLPDLRRAARYPFIGRCRNGLLIAGLRACTFGFEMTGSICFEVSLRGLKRGGAPPLLSVLPASTFGVFSSRIPLVCRGVVSGWFREPSRKPCRESTSGRFSRKLGVRRPFSLRASQDRPRKTVRKTDFRAVFPKTVALIPANARLLDESKVGHAP